MVDPAIEYRSSLGNFVLQDNMHALTWMGTATAPQMYQSMNHCLHIQNNSSI